MTELSEIISSFGFWVYFPILMLIAIPMLRYFLRMGSDDDDDDEEGEEVASKVIPRRNASIGRLTRMTMIPKQNRSKYDHDSNIITQKLKIKSADIEEPIICPNCGISVMTQWQKCYHCGELL